MSEDDHLTERCVASQQVYAGHFLDVRRDTVALPNGRETTREYIVHPGAVMVVALADDGRLVVERQYRHAMGRVMLEFPAGKIDADEPPFECAVRELAEETGYRAAEWARAGLMHNAIAYSTEFIEVWFARGLTQGAARLDDGEFLDVDLLAPEELLERAGRGELTDAKTLVGLLWLQNWRGGHWSLAWQPAAAVDNRAP
ncbi:MAG TPA: NUDIX hydrolase [Ideonella sp.]|nr:NUDIX hydrolase [Ideonella sp.]